MCCSGRGIQRTCAAAAGAAPTLMLMRSAREEVAPWAQQEPQYWGMCCSGAPRVVDSSGEQMRRVCWHGAPTVCLPSHGQAPHPPASPLPTHLVARGAQKVGAVNVAPVPLLGQLLGAEVGVRQRRLNEGLVVGRPLHLRGKHAGLGIAPPLRAWLCRLLRGQEGSLGGAAGGEGKRGESVPRRRQCAVGGGGSGSGGELLRSGDGCRLQGARSMQLHRLAERRAAA